MYKSIKLFWYNISGCLCIISDMNKHKLRIAVPEDAEELTEIAILSKQYWGYSDKMINLWLPELTVTPEFIEKSIGFVIEESNVIKGFWCRMPKGELSEGFLFVEPKSIGKGYGKVLWDAVMGESRRIGLKYLTWESDPNAASFYEKMGAKQIGIKYSLVIRGRQLPIMRYNL